MNRNGSAVWILVLALSGAGAACTWGSRESSTHETPSTASEAFEQIRHAVIAGKYGLAEQLLDANSSRFDDPTTRDRIHFMRGWIALSQRNYPEARRWFERIRDTNTTLQPIALYFRAQSHSLAEDHEHAAELYERLIDSFPGSRRAIEARFNLANVYFRKGRFEDAIQLYEIMQRNPNLQGELYLANRPQVLLNQADSLAALGRGLEALSRYETLYYDFPLTPEADQASGRIVSIRNELGEPPFSANPSRTLARARQLADNNRSRQAVQELEAVLPALRERGERSWFDGLLALGRALERDRRFPEARNAYRQALAIPGQNTAPVRLRMAHATVRTSEMQGIEMFLGIARDFTDPAVAGEALYHAARFHHVAPRIAEAKSLYEQINARFPKSDWAHAARFQLGWLDYLAGDYPSAIAWFEKTNEGRTSGEEYERAFYWQARALEKAGRTDEADAIYSRLWNGQNWHYYGALARGRLDRLPADRIFAQMLPEDGQPLAPAPLRQEPELAQLALAFSGLRRESVLTAMELLVLGLTSEAGDELDFVAQGNPPGEQVSRLLPLLEEAGDYRRLRTWGWNSLGKPSAPEIANVRSWRALYPRAYLEPVNAMAQKNALDARFILAIIREESAYDPMAASPANAHGLMQLIPETANQVAKSLKLGKVDLNGLRTPDQNILLGSTYLRQLIREFDGNVVYAVASYNGGPHNLRRWHERFGNLEADEFTEEIPFRETRNYVKKIFKSWSNYRLLYGPDGERLYALAIEQMLSPAPQARPASANVSLRMATSIFTPHRSDASRGLDLPVNAGVPDYLQLASEPVWQPSGPPAAAADPAREYPAVIEDEPGPAGLDPVRLSDIPDERPSPVRPGSP